jgi:hypothetical protein
LWSLNIIIEQEEAYNLERRTVEVVAMEGKTTSNKILDQLKCAHQNV